MQRQNGYIIDESALNQPDKPFVPLRETHASRVFCAAPLFQRRAPRAISAAPAAF